MTTRAAAKNKTKKPLETTLGKAFTNSNDDPIDLSHVRKPIDTSIFGLSQVLSLFETATDEIRKYISYECDIMYECRMCRTIFRSLANFILHKRKYCRESYNPRDHTNCRNICQETEFDILQNDTDDNSKASEMQNCHESSPIPPTCDSKTPTQLSNDKNSKDKKSLSIVLNNLVNKQENRLITEECLTEDCSNDSTTSSSSDSKNSIALQNVADTNSAVFQTMLQNMFYEHKTMSWMKQEVMEIHDIIENNEAIVGSDGKVISPNFQNSNQSKNSFVCTICNQIFSTKKTLKYHINYKHNSTRQIYKCPECNDTFASTWCVFRHLYKVHRKTPTQVRRLRDQIHANKIEKDVQPDYKDKTVKLGNKELDNLQDTRNIENQQWMDNLEGDNDLQRCGGCGRKFERKAALHSHSQFCTKRIAICNSLKENPIKKSQFEEKSDKFNKIVKESASDSENSGSRRRKPLVTQRLHKFDYFKINQEVQELLVKEIDELEEKLVNNTGKMTENLFNHQSTVELDKNQRKYLSRSNSFDDTKQFDIISMANDCVNSETSDKPIEIEKSEDEVVKESISSNCDFSNVPESTTINNKRKIEDSIEDQNSNLKCPKTSVEIVPEPYKITLTKKSIKYIDKEKHTCIPCKKALKSHRSLMKHMSVHFNWYRYQCKDCPFMSYNKSKCSRHVEKLHTITDEQLLKNYVLRIPDWKSIAISSEFQQLSCYKEHKTKQDIEEQSVSSTNTDPNMEPDKEVPLTLASLLEENEKACSSNSHVTPDKTSITLSSLLEENEKHYASWPNITLDKSLTVTPSAVNSQDPSMDVIMEVIFGSKVDISFNHVPIKEESALETENPLFTEPTEASPPSDSSVLRDNTRPVRHRTIPVQKDFLYDMKQISKSKCIKDKGELQIESSSEEKQKQLKVYTRKLKSKLKLSTEFEDVSVVPEVNGKLAQDINEISPSTLKR